MSWTIDYSHSEINFKVRHMMISNVHGEFKKFTGTVNFNPEQPDQTTLDIQIDAASINTNDEKRDGHLRSPDFLDAQQFPYLTFKSKRVQMIDESNAKLFGNLTIQDITREVALNVEFLGMAKAPWGTTSAGFAATTRINRKDWDLNWNVALETGGWLVSETIEISIELELAQVVETELATAIA
jgi:polyisoprenoid-binding protein YceI